MGCNDYYGSTYKSSPEQINKNRLERREHRQFVWKLYKQYREQGNIFGHRKTECPECGVSVKFEDQEDHEFWHDDLLKTMQDIARWTMPGTIG